MFAGIGEPKSIAPSLNRVGHRMITNIFSRTGDSSSLRKPRKTASPDSVMNDGSQTTRCAWAPASGTTHRDADNRPLRAGCSAVEISVIMKVWSTAI